MFLITRGASRSFTVEVRDGADQLVDLGTARIYFTVRVADTVVLAKANTAGGGSDDQIEVLELGKFRVKFTHADTDREPMIGVCDGFVVTALEEYLQAIPNQPFQITQAQTRAFPTP